MITKVTITGADDSINPSDLLDLSTQFPFVEWGILVSKKSMGSKRFPSSMWISRLHDLKEKYPNDLQLSCHVCGTWVRETLKGQLEGVQSLPLTIFDRMQLNTHGEAHEFTPESVSSLRKLELDIIFQYDNVNTMLLKYAHDSDLLYSTLFDLSHGVGKLPEEWPQVLKNVRCGYAGGLSPDNLKEQIDKILEKTNGEKIWIDMETHVRSNNDNLFDLEKVKKCLEISQPYIY